MLPTIALQVDLGASQIPHIVFDAIHLVLLLIVGYFAVQAFSAGASKVGWGFTLFVLGEISYIGYHTTVTTFLLSHTISEVLVVIAFVLVFLGVRDGETITRETGERVSPAGG